MFSTFKKVYMRKRYFIVGSFYSYQMLEVYLDKKNQQIKKIL